MYLLLCYIIMIITGEMNMNMTHEVVCTNEEWRSIYILGLKRLVIVQTNVLCALYTGEFLYLYNIYHPYGIISTYFASYTIILLCTSDYGMCNIILCEVCLFCSICCSNAHQHTIHLHSVNIISLHIHLGLQQGQWQTRPSSTMLGPVIAAQIRL